MLDAYDREINYLRLSVTQLFNPRCRYCMPEDGICKKRHDEMLTEDEMNCAVKAAAVGGIREVCLTTNGTLLPNLAESLKKPDSKCKHPKSRSMIAPTFCN